MLDLEYQELKNLYEECLAKENAPGELGANRCGIAAGIKRSLAVIDRLRERYQQEIDENAKLRKALLALLDMPVYGSNSLVGVPLNVAYFDSPAVYEAVGLISSSSEGQEAIEEVGIAPAEQREGPTVCPSCGSPNMQYDPFCPEEFTGYFCQDCHWYDREIPAPASTPTPSQQAKNSGSLTLEGEQ